jgi:hypothetical protein
MLHVMSQSRVALAWVRNVGPFGVGVLWMLASALGCRREPAPAPKPVVIASASSHAASLPAPSASATKKEPTLAERQALARYKRALGQGRIATSKHDYRAADAAFAEALAARPSDARALGERGYARLLDGRLDEASADLQLAQGRVSDKVLEGQIWYNLGLVAEKRGQAIAARDAFAFSFEANPTLSAKKKLAGKSSCAASVNGIGTPLEIFPSWGALWEAAGFGDPGERLPAPPTSEAIKAKLEISDCSKGCAAPNSAGDWQLLWEMPSGKLAMERAVDSGYAYRCGAGPTFTAHEAGNLLWVSTENTEYETTLCGECVYGDDGSISGCQTCCAGGPWHRRDFFIDKASALIVLRIEQNEADASDPPKQAVISFDAGSVQLKGNGCDWTIPLSGAAGPPKGPQEPPSGPDFGEKAAQAAPSASANPN